MRGLLLIVTMLILGFSLLAAPVVVEGSEERIDFPSYLYLRNGEYITLGLCVTNAFGSIYKSLPSEIKTTLASNKSFGDFIRLKSYTNEEGSISFTAEDQTYSIDYKSGYKMRYYLFAPGYYNDERLLEDNSTGSLVGEFFDIAQRNSIPPSSVRFLTGTFANTSYSKKFLSEIEANENTFLFIYISGFAVKFENSLYLATRDSLLFKNEIVNTNGFVKIDAFIETINNTRSAGVFLMLDGTTNIALKLPAAVYLEDEDVGVSNKEMLMTLAKEEFSVGPVCSKTVASYFAENIEGKPVLILYNTHQTNNALLKSLIISLADKRFIDTEGKDGRVTISEIMSLYKDSVLYTNTFDKRVSFSFTSYEWESESKMQTNVYTTVYEEKRREEEFEYLRKNFVVYRKRYETNVEYIPVGQDWVLKDYVIPGKWR